MERDEQNDLGREDCYTQWTYFRPMITSKLLDIIEEKFNAAKETNKINQEMRKKCKTVYGDLCQQSYNECTNKVLNSKDGIVWCDITQTEDGEEKCSEDLCDNPLSGEISEDLLQSAGEMFTYIVSCPSQERV